MLVWRGLGTEGLQQVGVCVRRLAMFVLGRNLPMLQVRNLGLQMHYFSVESIHTLYACFHHSKLVVLDCGISFGFEVVQDAFNLPLLESELVQVLSVQLLHLVVQLLDASSLVVTLSVGGGC